MDTPDVITVLESRLTRYRETIIEISNLAPHEIARNPVWVKDLARKALAPTDAEKEFFAKRGLEV